MKVYLIVENKEKEERLPVAIFDKDFEKDMRSMFSLDVVSEMANVIWEEAQEKITPDTIKELLEALIGD